MKWNQARGSVMLAMAAASLVVVVACVGDDPAPSSTTAGDVAALCEQYCDAVTQNCKDANSQYASFEECREMCAFMPAGKEGVRENSIQCRLAQAKAAGSKETCAASGPFGGGVCGTRCEGFCRGVVGNCGTDPYPDEGTCIETCNTFTFDPNLPEGPSLPIDGDTLNCRGVHLRLSLHAKIPHCSHTARISDVCNDGGDAGAH